MFKSVLALSVFVFGFAAQASDWHFGGSLTSLVIRSENDVNPDYSSLHSAPQIFAKALYGRFGATLEADQISSSGSTGSLAVKTTTTNVELWGRYEFLDHWRPFVSLGGGAYFDHIETSFQGSSVNSDGRRWLIGTGGGLSVKWWDYLLTEAELRVSAIEQSRDANISGILRFGFEI